MKTVARIALCLTALAVFPLAGRSDVTLPYSDNFDTDTLGQAAPGFNAARSSTSTVTTFSWLVQNPGGGTDYVMQNTLRGTNAFNYSSNLIQASALGGGANQNFVLSSNVQITTASSSYITGLVALATASDLVAETSGMSGYWATVTSAGAVTLFTYTGAGGTTQSQITGSVTGSLGAALNITDLYTLTLTGTYVGSSLTLNFTVTDDTTNASASTTGTVSTPSTGSYFGYDDKNAVSASTLTITDNNFNLSFLAVPEPSETALLVGGLGLVGLLTLARRRSLRLRRMA